MHRNYKICTHIILLILFSHWWRPVYAGYGTNSFFITMDYRLTPQESAEIARTNAECQPAIDDPDGHWGPIIYGCELSIRFEKFTFRTNESVIARIIYRNAGTNFLNYGTPFGGALDFRFRIRDQDGRELADSFKPARTTGHHGPWPPGTQYKYECNLTERFGLSKPGVYTILVHRRIRGPAGIIDVASGTATIKIVE